LGSLRSGNLPRKSNFQQLRGLDARTGRSNFDISEYMLLHLLDRLKDRQATLAMLCKTAVARRVLSHVWKSGWKLGRAEMRHIDAAAHFGAAVDACLLVCQFSGTKHSLDCAVFLELAAARRRQTIGWRDGRLVADVDAHARTRCLLAEKPSASWRSGIKHDCAAVMELRREGRRYRNGLGERVDLEAACVFPMLKSSELTEERRDTSNRYMLVPQRNVSDDPQRLAKAASKTWRYLQSHAEFLARRASSVYNNRPPFSIFGVGSYSFAPWKVAVSGLYKDARFVAVGPRGGKPVVLDDTANFLPCQSEAEARKLANLLNSPPAREFFSAFSFRDAKRPFTVELLRRLDLSRLAETV
jgi:hypothetical protein